MQEIGQNNINVIWNIAKLLNFNQAVKHCQYTNL